MLIRFLSILLTILVVLAPSASHAIEEIKQAAQLYQVYWKGLHIGDFRVEINNGSISSEIQSYGTAKKISKYSNSASSKFHKEGDTYIPTSYYTYLTQRQGDKKVNVNYDATGNITKESVVPPDKAYKRPPVKNESKKGTVDPLTAALIARDKISDALAKGETKFNFNIYDGRRLSRLDFTILGKDKIKALDKDQDVVKVNVRRSAIEGYTNNELKRMQGEEPDILVYLSTETLLPVKANAEAILGQADFKLVKECESLEQCK